MLDELWQRQLPSFLAMVRQFAELLWIHPQLPGHLDVPMTEVEPLSSIYPNLQSLRNARLRHVCSPFRDQLRPATSSRGSFFRASFNQ